MSGHFTGVMLHSLFYGPSHSIIWIALFLGLWLWEEPAVPVLAR